MTHCFDGYYAANDSERSLVPVSRLQAWIAQNIYLSLKSVPFSKDDETLVPEAGSCANCPKRTGFNTLLFSEVQGRFVRRCRVFQSQARRAHRTARHENAESGADFGELQRDGRNTHSAAPQLRRSRDPEKQERQGSTARRKTLCPFDPGHSRGRHGQGPSRESLRGPDLQDSFRRPAAGRKTAAPMEGGKDRCKPKGETDARLPAPPSGRRAQAGKAAVRNRGATHGGAVCLALAVARTGVPPCQTPRLAKSRKTLTIGKWPRKRGRSTRRRTRLALAVLIFEAMLIGPAGSATANKDDDPLADAASLYKVDTKALRTAVAKAEKEKAQKKNKAAQQRRRKPAPKAKTARK